MKNCISNILVFSQQKNLYRIFCYYVCQVFFNLNGKLDCKVLSSLRILISELLTPRIMNQR
jgi:hypothetical protein